MYIYIYGNYIKQYAEQECTSDTECSTEKSCINAQCLDPCTLRGACGINALCRVVLHKPRCSCPQCYIGMPQTACNPDPRCDSISPRPQIPSIGCLSDRDCSASLACHSQTSECRDPCADFKHSCEINKRCQVRNHQPMCVCKYGFVVNELGELTCAPDTPTCRKDFDCPANAACINGKCQNPCIIARGSGNNSSVIGGGNHNKLLCPKDKNCEVLDHRPICVCLRNCSPSLSICLRDNGCSANLACRNYRCIDPCIEASCPADAPCYVEEHKPVCKFCPLGFVPDTKYGCIKGNEMKSLSRQQSQ